MVKTTLYLDSDLAIELRQIAALKGTSQAELMRRVLAGFAASERRPAIPGIGEFDSGESNVSERTREVLTAASDARWRRNKSSGIHR